VISRKKKKKGKIGGSSRILHRKGKEQQKQKGETPEISGSRRGKHIPKENRGGRRTKQRVKKRLPLKKKGGKGGVGTARVSSDLKKK